MRRLLLAAELVLLVAVIILPRCWKYSDVFVGDTVYFTDPDCYSRMSRVRLCWEHPGMIVRHQDFENFPDGTRPHATAPFDYAIVFTALALKPFATNPVDLAGAWISPLLGLAGGVFLWWWCRRVRFRYRWPALLLYAFSPILVHGTLLGRPDHQSLLILLILVAIGLELGAWIEGRKAWRVAAGISWGFALWVSLYEPLLFFALTRLLVFAARRSFGLSERRGLGKSGWISLAAVLVIALAIEQRLPGLGALADPLARNWARSIGELQPVPFVSQIWLSWGSFLLLAAPLLYLLKLRRIKGRKEFNAPALVLAALCLCAFGLTMWQARWAYFLVSTFVLLLPALLEVEPRRWLVYLLVFLCFWPVAKDWDAMLFPSVGVGNGQWAERHYRTELHSIALLMRSPQREPFLAPWWLSPELAYWSGQPGVAGSSHESLPGIEASARFFSATDGESAEEVLRARRVGWVVVYDADATAENTSDILGRPISPEAFGYRLDRAPSSAPAFLMLRGQDDAAKLFLVNNR